MSYRLVRHIGMSPPNFPPIAEGADCPDHTITLVRFRPSLGKLELNMFCNLLYAPYRPTQYLLSFVAFD